MMKNIKRLLAVLLAVIMCVGAIGCETNSKDSLVYLNYSTGMDEFGRYNYELYGMNGRTDPDGADPGVFYLSVEEDPEWGGYFYRYTTGSSTYIPSTEYYTENDIVKLTAYCDRSKDLYHWETVGVLAGGYSCAIAERDWCDSDFWAPEVIRNPSDGKYYLYFSAAAKADLGLSYVSASANSQDRFYIAVAVADTPAGPFRLVCDFDEETGTRIPTINFQTGFNLDYNIAAIDASPFFDENGELYLYFVRHPSDNHTGNVVCGMKMESMAYPDYSTATVLAYPGKTTVTATAGDLENFQSGESYFVTESNVNEGPFMYKHNGLYYLTYSSNGYAHVSYSVHQAVGESPLGPFTKLSQEQGNPVLDGSVFGDVNGTGHHSLVKNGDELWIVYHRHASVYNGVGWTRPTAVDRVNFVTNSEGIEVMTANGPSRILNWLPEYISGYTNLAQTAQISVSNGTGAQYLVDEILPLYNVTAEQKLFTEKGDLTITLTWQEPVSISSVMIYNSVQVSTAFSQVSDIRFKLAEKPAWATQEYDWAVIQNLQIQSGAWDETSEDYLECAPAVAEIDPILITQLQITIREEDRLVAYDKLGNINTALNISEIVVLGEVEANG